MPGELRVYRYSLAVGMGWEQDGRFNKNEVSELLAFSPSEPWQSRQEFLSGSLSNLERGSSVYTYMSGGRLLHSGWCHEGEKNGRFPDIDQDFEYPDKSAVLSDFYTQPSARGQGLYQDAWRKILYDHSVSSNIHHVSIAVPANHRPACHVVEKVGFLSAVNFLYKRRFNKVGTTRVQCQGENPASLAAG